MHNNGQGVPQDYAAAVSRYRKAADQGVADAQTNLGVMYFNGLGVPQDDAAAVSWYRKAADQENATAQYNLGVMYENGRGVPQDYAAAVSWYRKAADQGDVGAFNNLGVMYMNGRGVPQDYAAAMSWYRKATDHGIASAQYNLGVMYRNAEGVPRNYAAAVSWFRKAADQGHADAQYSLGLMYRNADGVPQDYAAAVSWYRKAADQEHASALGNLGVMYFNGQGVPQDLVQAHKWFSLSAASCDHALTLQPNSVEAWRVRGGALQNMQRLEEAVASYDQVLAIDPDDSSALLKRGSLLCEMNRVPEGFEAFSRYAARVYGAAPSDEPTAPDHKQRHDREQREYLAAQGVEAGSFHIAGGARLGGPAVNPANREIVASEWANSNPQMVVIDNLLTEEALDGLRRFCWGSTVWRKPYVHGYLGAFDEDGFACPLLAQIADEMREVFPTVMAGHGLVRTWAFKYDSSLGGIQVHGDQAAVNVNFWITPNDSNLNPDSGGMVIWDTAAPTDWEFARYNKDDDAIYAFLAGAGAKSTTIPHRSNRAVVFDSDLFHETDKTEFKDGYLDRRINVTMLYGRRSSLNY